MRTSQFLILLILIIMILMAVTNPGLDDYANWITEQSNGETSSQLENLISNFVGEPMIKRTTRRDNYIIFSVYETEIPDSDEERSRTIGIFGNFFVLNNSDR
ncbi:MAG: DUF4359 domain-containing protein [Bacillota bacterium]